MMLHIAGLSRSSGVRPSMLICNHTIDLLWLEMIEILQSLQNKMLLGVGVWGRTENLTILDGQWFILSDEKCHNFVCEKHKKNPFNGHDRKTLPV